MRTVGEDGRWRRAKAHGLQGAQALADEQFEGPFVLRNDVCKKVKRRSGVEGGKTC